LLAVRNSFHVNGLELLPPEDEEDWNF